MKTDKFSFSPTPFHDGLPWPGVLRTKRMELAAKERSGTPHEIVRAICQDRLPQGEILPPTKSFEGYHIRGVSGNAVIYTPIFAYVLDVGWDTLPTLHLFYSVVGQGDPKFPDFANVAAVTTTSRKPQDIIFPAVAGDILFAVEPGTTMAQIQAALGSLVGSVEVLAPDTYTGKVRAFRERHVGDAIQAAASFVRYAELNWVQRIIDFKPGWQVDRVF